MSADITSNRPKSPNVKAEPRRNDGLETKLEPNAGVGSSDLLGDVSTAAKELGACWPRLARTALEASISLQHLTLLVSRSLKEILI